MKRLIVRSLIVAMFAVAAMPALSAQATQAAKPTTPAAAPTMAPAKAAPAKAAPQKPATTAKSETKVPQVDINTATLDELKAVKGIGDAYAAKIIAGRPYKTKLDLKTKNILQPGVYDKVKDALIAKQPAKK